MAHAPHAVGAYDVHRYIISRGQPIEIALRSLEV